jgi:MFS family permease
MNVVLGALGDRLGHKIILAGAALAMAAASLSILLVPTAAWLPVTFLLLGVSMAGNMVSGLNIILEFCSEADRPTYIGLTNTLLAPATTLAPILGGWLATVMGYGAMFAIALVCALAGSAWLAFAVREPRLDRGLPVGAP